MLHGLMINLIDLTHPQHIGSSGLKKPAQITVK